MSFNTIKQICLIVFTVGGYLLISLKMPQYGLLVALIGQMFWIPASYRAWKEAGQIGIFITTIFITVVVLGGVINYWLL